MGIFHYTTRHIIVKGACNDCCAISAHDRVKCLDYLDSFIGHRVFASCSAMPSVQHEWERRIHSCRDYSLVCRLRPMTCEQPTEASPISAKWLPANPLL